MAPKPGLHHALAEIADRGAGPCHLAGEAAHDLAVRRRAHADLEQPALKHLAQVVGAVQVVVGHGIAVAGIGAPGHRDGVVGRHQAHRHGRGRSDVDAAVAAGRGAAPRASIGVNGRRLTISTRLPRAPRLAETDRIREPSQGWRRQARALARFQAAEVEGQPRVFDGHHDLPGPPQHHQVEGRRADQSSNPCSITFDATS